MVNLIRFIINRLPTFGFIRSGEPPLLRVKSWLVAIILRVLKQANLKVRKGDTGYNATMKSFCINSLVNGLQHQPIGWTVRTRWFSIAAAYLITYSSFCRLTKHSDRCSVIRWYRFFLYLTLLNLLSLWLTFNRVSPLAMLPESDFWSPKPGFSNYFRSYSYRSPQSISIRRCRGFVSKNFCKSFYSQAG